MRVNQKTGKGEGGAGKQLLVYIRVKEGLIDQLEGYTNYKDILRSKVTQFSLIKENSAC